MELNPRHLILQFLLTVEGGVLAVREAINACGVFGIRENSVRVALVRLSASGMVEAAGRGCYRLGPQATRLADDVRGWHGIESRLGPWTGGWIVAHCTGLGRSDRSQLQRRDRALALLGFRALERELFVRPDNLTGSAESARTRLQNLGLEPEAAVFVASGFDSEREARARLLWDGVQLNQGYRQTREKLERWLERADQLDMEAAARESFLLGSAGIRQLIFDPLLPEPLVDAGLRHAFIETLRRFDDEGHDIWRRFWNSASPLATVENRLPRSQH